MLGPFKIQLLNY